MCLVCVLHKLIILSKFVTEKEKKSRKRKNATLTLQQNNCICCFIKFLCYFESECECVNDKSVKFQLMHYDYTSYLLTTHLDYPNYTCAFGGVNRSVCVQTAVWCVFRQLCGVCSDSCVVCVQTAEASSGAEVVTADHQAAQCDDAAAQVLLPPLPAGAPTRPQDRGALSG